MTIPQRQIQNFQEAGLEVLLFLRLTRLRRFLKIRSTL
jgi:hypothetical protein